MNRFFRRSTATVTLGLVSMLTITGCGSSTVSTSSTNSQASSSSSGSKAPIKIGMYTSLTGPLSDMASSQKNGMLLAIDQYNAKGGYHGHKIVPVVYDDQFKPQVALQDAKRLISQDHVIAINAAIASGDALAADGYIEGTKVPEIISGATATVLGRQYAKKSFNYIFHFSMVDGNQIRVMAKWFKYKGFKRVGLMYDTTGYGMANMKQFDQIMKKDHINVVSQQSFTEGSSNLQSQLLKLKQAKAQVVAMYSLGPDDARIVKTANSINYHPYFVGSWTASQQLFRKLAGNLMNKKVYVVQSFTTTESAAAKKFQAEMLKKFHKDLVPVVAAQSYDATNIILDALNKVGPNSQKIATAIETMKNFKGVTGTYPSLFKGSYAHNAIPLSSMFMAKYVHGALMKTKD